jgi:hypothetical protein
LNKTLAKLHDWVSIVLADGFETAMAGVPGEKGCINALELVGAITDLILSQAEPLDRDVLHKSLEEALFLCVGPDPQLTRAEFDLRLSYFLRRHGIPALLRLLLSLYLFNVVCIQSEKSFRMFAGTEKAFQRYLEQIEHACRRIVRAAWMSQSAAQSSAGAIPENLIEIIESRLWET